MPNMTSRAALELSEYFATCAELMDAKKAKDAETVELALGIFAGLWLHAASPKLRDRCADLLERNGWAGEMDRLCEEA